MSFLTWAQGIYVLASIFGVGVTAIDLLGILGTEESDSGGGDIDGDAEIAEMDLEAGDVGAGADQIHGEVHNGDISHGDDFNADASHADTTSSDLVQTDGESDSHQHSVTGPGSFLSSTLILLTFLRRAVYFSLGFGPVGLVAVATGSTALTSLLWAIPCGILSAMVAGWVFRFQRKDVDSSVTRRDLFFQRARVLVPIMDGGMGKVRVSLGQSVVERYARAEDRSQSFSKGAEVYVTRVTRDCVYVEAFSKQISNDV